MQVEERLSNFYSDDNSAFVVSSSQTNTGLWIQNQHAEKLSSHDDAVIGAALRRCLAHCVIGIKHPEKFGGETSAVLKLARERSWTSFMRRFENVGIGQAGSEYWIYAKKNHGSRGGYTPLEKFVVPSNISDEELGRVINRALQVSKVG